jgi:hypothetical protein
LTERNGYEKKKSLIVTSATVVYKPSLKDNNTRDHLIPAKMGAFNRTGATIFLWVTQDQTTTTFTVNGEDFPSIGIEIESMDELTNNLKQYGSEVI